MIPSQALSHMEWHADGKGLHSWEAVIECDSSFLAGILMESIASSQWEKVI